MITTVIFDMDDTLYDEVDYCRSGFRAVADFLADKYEAYAEEAFDALWSEFCSGNHDRTFNAALDILNITYETEDVVSLVNLYRTHKPQISLPDESREILDLLASKYPLGLLTDGFLPAQELKVAALGIEKYFKHIVYTEKLGRQYWKPNPRGFEIILEKLQAKPETTVYIADNARKDFIGPNELKMHTIQLKRANKVHLLPAEDETAAPDEITDSIRKIPGILDKLAK
jgi:putative hydrolase of the HAD superfamily